MPDWYVDALCPQTDPEVFFPSEGQSGRAAKTVCATCPVRSQCLDWAMENCELFGVWGGVSSKDRQKMRREQEAA